MMIYNLFHLNVLVDYHPKDMLDDDDDDDDYEQNVLVMLVQMLNNQMNVKMRMIDFHLMLEQINNHLNEPDT
jgi:hypothetical protein